MSDVVKKLDGRLLVVMPAYNEGSTIFDVVRSIGAHVDADVLVISDASADDTCKQAEAAGAKVLQLASNLGAWSATQAGIRYAVRHGYTHVITMDADGQHLPCQISALIHSFIETKANIVIGTYPQRASRLRQIAWQWFRIISGLSIQDLTSGFRLYDSHAINVLVGREATMLEHQDVGILLLLKHAGMKLVETQTMMTTRQSGKSRIFRSWWVVAKYMVHTSVFCFAYLGLPKQRATANTKSYS